MKSFFSALTDRSFTTFITRPVAGVLYLILMVLIVISVALLMVVGIFSITQGNFLEGLVGLVLGPIAGLLTLILTRLFFESGVALVLIAENTRKK
jgi:hypothetical protein